MILVDVNVLVAAHRPENPDHDRLRSWLESELASERTYGMSELVLSGFLRVVTHPQIFREPTPVPIALDFVEAVRDRPNCAVVKPGSRHWGIFTRLYRETGARGNLVPDAYLAALAIESGSDWITLDRGFARFPDLRWRHPLGPA